MNLLDYINSDFISLLANLCVDSRISLSKKFLLIDKHLKEMQKEYKNLINEE